MIPNNPKLAMTVAALASLLASQAAHATLSITGSLNGGAPSGSTKLNFEDLTLGSGSPQTAGGVATVEFTGAAAVVQNSSSGVYAAPFFNDPNNDAGFTGKPAGADPSQYLTTGIGTVRLIFDSEQTYLGLFWGSLDSYNKLELFDKAGGSLGTVVPGVDIDPSGGVQTAGGSIWVDIDSSTPFKSVVMSSTQNAFEFDNVAIVPEPSTYFAAALLGLPFMASVVRRRMAKTA